MLLDPEDEFSDEEIEKLQSNVREDGLSVVVMADWFDTEVIAQARFFDESTRSWWEPVTGYACASLRNTTGLCVCYSGANVPALNDLLQPFGISFGARVYSGEVRATSADGETKYTAQFQSGVPVARFPAGGHLMFAEVADQSAELSGSKDVEKEQRAVGGAVHIGHGKVAVFGDSNCIDENHNIDMCFWLFDRLLTFATTGVLADDLFPNQNRLYQPFTSGHEVLQTSSPEVHAMRQRLAEFSNTHKDMNSFGRLCHPLDFLSRSAVRQIGHSEAEALDKTAIGE